jgi:hypothetical protein
MTTSQRVLELAGRDVGYKETPVNITVFGSRVDGGKWQGQPWCGVWVRDVFNRAGLPNEPSSVWTPGGAEAYQRAGRWLGRYQTPPPGSVIFFDWAGSQSVRAVDHVGFVKHANPDGTITTLEGNTQSGTQGNQSDGGGVYQRTRPRTVIVGYGLPRYDAVNIPPPPPLDWPALRRMAAAKLLNDGIATIPTIRQGSIGSAVRLWQTALNLVADTRLSEDGAFGAATTSATKKFQAFFKLAPDGVVGPQTRTMMEFVLHQIRVHG